MIVFYLVAIVHPLERTVGIRLVFVDAGTLFQEEVLKVKVFVSVTVAKPFNMYVMLVLFNGQRLKSIEKCIPEKGPIMLVRFGQ